jgi:hypothetical protein
LAGSDIACPLFESYAARLVQFVKKNPAIASAGLA